VADSSQKILKELSDLTRNLDVLAKEIRVMNKNTASVQDAVVKSVEKKEVAADKAENKSSTPDAGKVIAETKKEQDNMFTKFLESLKKNSDSGNNEIKKAGLEGIKSAGKNLLETKSLKSAAKAGLVGILKSGKNSIVEAVRKKREENKSAKAESITSKEGLKEKEKVKKEEGSAVIDESSEKKVKETEKKDKKSILEKLNIRKKSKEEKLKAEREKTVEGKIENAEKKNSEEKVEKKGLLSRLREKISGKDIKKEDSLTDLSKEKIDQKDSALDSAIAGAQEKKEPPSLKSIVTGISPDGKSPASNNTKDNLKEKSKQIFQKTTLGSTIKGFTDAIGKKKTEDASTPPSSVQNDPEKLSIRSKIEKAGTELKSRFKFKKKDSSVKEKSETPVNKEPSTPVDGNKPMESKDSEKISGSKSEEKKNESDKSKSPEISAQDIADIKALLSSINATLNGPLNIKDNKPYRPHSNMLG
jgi:hypothetical protein